ncbi:MAG TPA: hypothetical protein VLQ80_03530, partial [Candidatus Saccharimonadia bacterium]|nr:hypothetical protein [Candidatus Saccharimonadia bacterium]
MPIALTPIIPSQTEYASPSQSIKVNMQVNFLSRDEFRFAIQNNRVDHIKCIIKHGIEVKDNRGNQFFAKDSTMEWIWKGNIQNTSTGSGPYTFVSNPDPRLHPPPTMPTYNLNAPRYSNLQKLSVTLQFDPLVNATQELKLLFPVSLDWTGTLTVSFPGSGIQDSSPLRLVHRPWGLP